MLSNRYVKILGWLILANIVYYFYSNWGLVTVKAHDVPLSKVISSIEWQGWVKIYTNLPADTKVSMYVDHVPLAEAMETLAANVTAPPPPDDAPDRPNRENRPNRPDGGVPGAPGATGTLSASGTLTAPGTPGAPGNGGPRGGRGGFGRGGGGVQWNLAFFVAPTASQVKQEIYAFQAGDSSDDRKVYTYGTQLQLVANTDDTPAADPRLQSWPGIKAPDSSAPAPNAPAAQAGDAPAAPVAPAAPPTPTVQTYLQAFAQSANIWIMAPATWDDESSTAPPASSSIISAVKNFISRSHGAVTEAIVLRAGLGGAWGGVGADSSWADRMRNAINTLPPDDRADALDQLTQEIQFRDSLKSLAPDDRRQKMRQHMLDKMINGNGLARLSPEKRAERFQRMIAARQAAKGKT